MFKSVLKQVFAALIGLAVLSIGVQPALAADPQQWMKKMKKQKTRKMSSKQTMVAAVRGVDEPGDVDPEARNFEGVQKMEKRNYGGEKIYQFMTEGKLTLPKSAVK